MGHRTYDQYCPVAAALDVVGDRWTLLIMRELLIGDRRFTDLRAGAPGHRPQPARRAAARPPGRRPRRAQGAPAAGRPHGVHGDGGGQVGRAGAAVAGPLRRRRLGPARRRRAAAGDGRVRDARAVPPARAGGGAVPRPAGDRRRDVRPRHRRPAPVDAAPAATTPRTSPCAPRPATSSPPARARRPLDRDDPALDRFARLFQLA